MPQDIWNRQPAWEEGRYLTLLMDPIGPDGEPESLLQSFYKTADIGISLISIGAAAFLASLEGLPNDLIASSAMFLTGIHILSREIDRSVFHLNSLRKSGFSHTDIETKCIDKRPTPERIKLSEEFRLPAGKESDSNKTKTLITAMIPLVTLPFAPYAALCLALALAPLLARAANAALAFENVAHGRWAIVNKPEPVSPAAEAEGYNRDKLFSYSLDS